MSLILGIYSKKDNICDGKIKQVLREFSLDNVRTLHTVRERKILLSFSKSKIDGNNIIENENKTSIILFGGRMYNFNDRVSNLLAGGHKFKHRKNNAEFMLHSYEEYGESFLKEINGIFGFAIYNRLNDELIIVNDSFGFYPLFIYNDDEHIIFSSEYEPITKYRKFDNRLNYDAIAEYFTLGVPLEGKTFFKNINNLYPGSVFRMSKNKVNIKQYDDLNIKVDKGKNIDFFSRKASKLIHDATQARAENPKDIRCFLTGGADTRLILANLTKRQRESISFYTRAEPWVKTSEDQDVLIAGMLAKRFNLRHTVIKNTKNNANDFNVSFFKKTRERPCYKRTLHSVGGGEYLGGSCFASSFMRPDGIKKGEISARLKEIFKKKFLKNISNPYYSLKKTIKRFNAENKELLFHIYHFRRGFMTRRLTRSSASWISPYRHALRYESIFLDKNFLKFLLTVPKRYIENRMLYDHMYKNHFRDLLEIPTTRETLNPIKKGKNPDLARKSRNDRALNEYIKSRYTYSKQFYP